MQDYGQWKINEGLQDDIGRVKEIFANLKQEVKQISKGKGFFGRLGQNIMGGIKNVGKGIKSALRPNNMPTTGQSATQAQGRPQDTTNAWNHLAGIGDSVENNGQLLIEWNAESLNAILKAINDAEREIVGKLESTPTAREIKPDLRPEFGAVGGSSSWSSDDTLQQIKTELPETFEALVKAEKYDEVIAQLLKGIKGGTHAKTVLIRLAGGEKQAQDLANKIDKKYNKTGTRGALAAILMGKHLGGNRKGLSDLSQSGRWAGPA